MKTQTRNLHDYVEECHTEFCGGSGIGYEMEQVENEITDLAIAGLLPPRLSEITAELENLRNSDDETATDLLKRSVENWIGEKCLEALFASKKFKVTQNHLETLTILVTLADNWQEWLN